MLVDKTVLVTGASSGIGRACAEQLAAAGARLVLCARRADRLEALAAELDAEVHAFALDVRDRAAVEETLAGLPPAWREIDVLVNNAGLAAGHAPLQDGDPGDWERMVDTNVKGLLWVTRAVVPGMVERGRGHVVNIGSIAGRETYPGGAVYCASKGAVDRITRGLRMDLLGTGVRVSTIDPGLVETEFSLVRLAGDAEKAKAIYAGLTPLEAKDIADVVRWVATRPPHVVIADVLVYPVDQAGSGKLARRNA